MDKLHIITPVKDSLETAERAISALMSSVTDIPFEYTVYNDFSSDENTQKLEALSKKYSFHLINLKEITSHPSPNYLLVLQKAQAKALNDK
ncbi:MAG: glycosyltransferase family 2 protein, partial [Prevotellaceae bacterium]|nr:glycosyltransferase family 2 protein [Prevotellaceae bacterium]